MLPNPINQHPIYFVTDHALTGGRPILEVIRHALEGGIRLIQYRHKIFSKSDFKREAIEVLRLCRDFDATLIVNDHFEIAAEIGAHGAHLGQDDGDIINIRKKVGESFILGLSTHQHDEVLSAQTLPVTYINIGPMFATQTKDHTGYPAIGMDGVFQLAKSTRHAWTTMGGIKRRHLPEFFSRGGKTAAMVTEISLAPDIREACRELLLIAKT